ncbi:MAG: hypothetical protein WA830_21180 [Candidatus Sulfotelmatobacter sp.]
MTQGPNLFFVVSAPSSTGSEGASSLARAVACIFGQLCAKVNSFHHHYSETTLGSVVFDTGTTRAASNQIRQAQLRLQKFLSTWARAEKTVALSNQQAAFAQGDSADAVFYNRECKIRLPVVTKNDKAATLGISSQGDFSGKG